MDLAQVIDDKNEVLDRALELQTRRNSKPFGGLKLNFPINHSSPNANWENVGGKPSPSQENATTGLEEGPKGEAYKRLTDAELQRRREKGLCFRYEERFAPGHRCQSKQVILMLVADEDEDEDEEETREEEEGELEEEMTVKLGRVRENVELPMNSIIGMTTAKTMKLRGKIQGREAIMLIDSGATHNFISSTLVDEIQLATEPTKTFGVQIGDRRYARSSGVCRGVKVEVQNLEIEADFFPFELDGVEVILGIAWLQTLGGG